MLVEVRLIDWGSRAFLPADPAGYPERCYHIDEADWRYLVRFRQPACCAVPNTNSRSRTSFPQTRYSFKPGELEPMLGAPYGAESDAG